MLHDPETYPNPEKFVPERYEGLSREELERVDPRGIVFGFGRRYVSSFATPYFLHSTHVEPLPTSTDHCPFGHAELTE